MLQCVEVGAGICGLALVITSLDFPCLERHFKTFEQRQVIEAACEDGGSQKTSVPMEGLFVRHCAVYGRLGIWL